jgi:hypothetical protein
MSAEADRRSISVEAGAGLGGVITRLLLLIMNHLRSCLLHIAEKHFRRCRS